MRNRTLLRAFTAGVAALIAWCGPCAGSALGPQDTPPVPASVATPAAGEVQLDVEQFGVGNVVRPGDWCGLRVRIVDGAPKQREVVIQLSVPDADSDRVLVQREITTNPGVPQGTWLYFRLPAMFRAGEALNVSAYEAVETAGAGLRAGRMLGTNRLIAKSVCDPTTGIMAVIGPKSLGLNRYQARSQGGNGSYPPFGHEVTEVISGLTPDKLPDRWIGYAPLEIIVWGQGNPGEVRDERAAALKEWVRRGGHLVIVLPSVGETWTNPQASELYELMPAVAVNRREGIDLNNYRPLITFEPRVALPQGSVVYQFTRPEGVPASDAMLLMTGITGDCVVARLYGAGTVTVVGIDLNNRSLAELEGLEPGVFWNRVLGRRGILPTDRQFKGEILKGEVPTRGGEVDFDTEIVGLISQTSSAAAGVLLGLVVFVGYWLVAGPLGFMLLKRRGWVRHSWLAFFVAGLAFTAIAWGGATMIKPRKVSADHITLLDHVFGQPVDRARAWLSVLIPWYGTATIAIADGPERSETTNLLTAWDPPTATGPVGSFPDARGYVVDARSPSKLTIPTRSTAKQIQADWAGGPVWKMPFPVTGLDGRPEPLSAVETVSGVGSSFASGSLTHGLPGVLQDVLIIVVPRQQPLRLGGVDWTGMNANARAFSPDDWHPGAVLDLAVATRINTNNDMTLASDKFKRLRDSWSVGDDLQRGMAGAKKIEPVDAIKRLAGVAFFSQLEPPGLGETSLRGAPIARRRLTHTWDLGRWFSQPCIIIVGRLGDDKKPCPCPIPLTVNDEKLPTTGTTIVRWIYPLPDNPPDPTPKPSPQPRDQDATGGG